MLTIKLITENTDAVIRGLEKKHFKGAKESIDKVLELNDKRRIAQNQLDKNLAEVNATSKSIGQLMKEGKKEEAEAAKKHVSEIKEVSKALQAEMDQAAEELQNLLYTIPNVPYDEVPEGTSAEDNVVEKMGGMETELPKNALPHWELAKKYDLIDYDIKDESEDAIITLYPSLQFGWDITQFQTVTAEYMKNDVVLDDEEVTYSDVREEEDDE